MINVNYVIIASFSLVDSELVCEKCGYTEDIIINSEKTS